MSKFQLICCLICYWLLLPVYTRLTRITAVNLRDQHRLVFAVYNQQHVTENFIFTKNVAR